MMLKNRWKKAACLILTIISAVCLGKVDVKAADYWPDAPETLSPGVILMEESTGTILYEKNMDEAHYPASITKIMTTLLALENGNLSDMVTFSDDAINNTEGSGIARDYGEQMTLEQCLYGVMLESANECAYAVAEHVGGTVENFVDMMNAKANSLGMSNTHFVNPNGLPAKDQYTTARDMMLLARAYLHSHLEMLVYHNTHYLRHGQTLTWNKNPLLGNFEGADGLKTGWVNKSGYNIIATAERDGHRILAVVLGAPDPLTRGQECCRLLDAGFLASSSAGNVPYDSILQATPADIYHPDWKLTAREALATLHGADGGVIHRSPKNRKNKGRRMRTAER